MKFNCGLTEGEKIKKRENWHDKFAWLPKRVASGDCRWLEIIERRETCMSIWKYRAKETA